ncbi:demethylmenaquinone methyltransferase [archaeon BMS3Abin17]|nr:demethylmenaquinone methyltransferase [archaeon BMS3Abin17]HDZ61101.1 class I SAM-dependent methyltransferase [Candidatus Pacearchaeota archaeon]
MKDLTPKQIKDMDYNELIGITKETNRIPGGRKTVFEIVNRTCIDRHSKVLEIGTSTGFTAIELSKLIPCYITSIDINEISLKETRKRAIKEKVENLKLLKADVNKLPFDDESFDLVIIGNVLSLMSNKEQAFNECRRVCKKSGFIVAVPMYYIVKPFNKLIKEVSEAIQVNISPLFEKDWDKFFDIPNLEVYYTKKFKFDYIMDKEVKSFVENILDRAHLKEMRKDTLNTLYKKYKDYMYLFRDNLSKMGFSIILLSNKMVWEDKELYTSKEIK